MVFGYFNLTFLLFHQVFLSVLLVVVVFFFFIFDVDIFLSLY